MFKLASSEDAGVSCAVLVFLSCGSVHHFSLEQHGQQGLVTLLGKDIFQDVPVLIIILASMCLGCPHSSLSFFSGLGSPAASIACRLGPQITGRASCRRGSGE
jgi:hypothetical protein